MATKNLPNGSNPVSNEGPLDHPDESLRERRIRFLSDEMKKRLKTVSAKHPKNGKLQGETNELIREVEESIERKSHQLDSDKVFEIEVKRLIENAEGWLKKTVAAEEEKETKEEKEKKRKEEEEKKYRSRREQEEKEAEKAEKEEGQDHKEKVASRLEELRQEARGEKPIEEIKYYPDGKNVNLLPGTEKERVEQKYQEVMAKARATDAAAEANIKHKLPTVPAIVVPENIQKLASEQNIYESHIKELAAQRVEQIRNSPPPPPKKPPIKLPASAATKEARKRISRGGPAQRKAIRRQEVIEEVEEYEESAPQVGGFRTTITTLGSGGGSEPSGFDEGAAPSEGRGADVTGNPRADSPSSSQGGTRHTGANRGDNDSGGSAGGGSGGGVRRPNPNIRRGGFGKKRPNLMRKLEKELEKRLRKEVLQKLAASLFTSPYFWIGLGILIIILLLIAIITGGQSSNGTDQPCSGTSAPAETLTAKVTGPQTAKNGDTLTYTVTIADTQPDQDITIIYHIPDGVSLTPTDITSSWTKMNLDTTQKTITWKASENMQQQQASSQSSASSNATQPANNAPPANGAATVGNLPNTNFNFTVSFKATADNTNLVNYVEVDPMRGTAGGAQPAAGGDIKAQGELTTQEYMNIYGHNQSEVEANLVAIDFQGHQVKVHKSVQGVFQKVNNEITQANTGYAFRLVSTFNWRPKNIPGQTTTELSTHSFGIAIDINQDTNPYTTANTHDIPPAVVDIFKKNGFEWGGDFTGQHDWMHFQYEGPANAIAATNNSAPAAGSGGCPPANGGGAGGPTSQNYVAPTDNDCGGKYKFSTPIGKNFGDPNCDFSKDKAYALLKQLDPQYADEWFNKIEPCESGFNPNAYAGPQTGTPDAAGAWGQYQMGSAQPPGSPPPAPGKNGPNDRGDVNWQQQIVNATSYRQKIGDPKKYWACAR